MMLAEGKVKKGEQLMAGKPVLFNVDLWPGDYARLENLRVRLGLDTLEETIERALTSRDFKIDEVREKRPDPPNEYVPTTLGFGGK